MNFLEKLTLNSHSHLSDSRSSFCSDKGFDRMSSWWKVWNWWQKQMFMKKVKRRKVLTFRKHSTKWGIKVYTSFSKFKKSHKLCCHETLKEVFFFGKWNELFWQKRFEPAVIVVWPWELVRLIGNCLENIFITYHMVIRRLEKFLRACEVQLETFDF